MAKEHSESLYREEELAFFGAVTASISHDLNNAIAIIEQTAGLLEDLLLEGEDDQSVSKEQLQRVVERIDKQTKRGANIVRRLNAFAHSVDEPQREIDLNVLTENVAALAHRMVDRKRAQLEIMPADATPKIQSNPFRVQQAVYFSIKETLSQAPEGAHLVLSTGSLDGQARIDFVGESSGEPQLSYLETLMSQLGGSVDSTLDGGQLTITLIFPLA
jgi:light-regulated signal transduction histidine kinase (bacteriophytochrome)